MDTLKYIKRKFALRYHVPMPIALPIERTRGLTGLFRELGYKVGAEIGTQKAFYAQWLLSRVKGLKLYCVDPWTWYEDYIDYGKNSTQKTHDDFFEIAKNKLKGKNVEFIRKFSVDAVKDFEDNSLDFVYIDGNHQFEYVISDVAAWEKKVRVGGIVAGHDYRNSIDRAREDHKHFTKYEKIKVIQVKTAIDAWTLANRIKPWFHTTGEKSNSWFYVKQ